MDKRIMTASILGAASPMGLPALREGIQKERKKFTSLDIKVYKKRAERKKKNKVAKSSKRRNR